MPRKMKALLAVTAFNALTAIAGGISLMTGVIEPPSKLLEHTAFDSYFIPGLVLAVVVGGAALFATVWLLLHKAYAREIAGAAGVIMMGWITAEVLMIRQISWLQVLYFLTGYAATALAYPSRNELSGSLPQGGNRP